MKILQIIQRPQLRGAEIFACQLATELKKRNQSVDIAYLFTNNSFDLDFSLNYIPVGGNSSKRFWDISAYRRLHKIITEGKYDIIQANASDTLKYAVFSKVLFRWRTPLVYRNANKLGDFIKNRVHRMFNRFLLSFCDYFISVSESCRKDIFQVYPDALKRSETISIGTYEFINIEPSEIRNSSEPILINIASFVDEKNHAFLLDVFHAFVQRHHKGYLWLVGDGRLRKSLESQAVALGLAERVVFFGFRKDALQLLKASDLMVMPSKIEGLPGVIIEALSCGIPVIASNVGGIPEIIKDEETGFIVDGWNIDAYVERIENVLWDDALKKKLIENGRELVKANFTMPTIADKFLRAYRKLKK